MYKEFNVLGNCVPEKHYMAPVSDKIETILPLIKAGKYILLRAARQFGKTTLINEIRRTLKNEYLVINISMEGTDDTVWRDTQSFCKSFANTLVNYFKYSDIKKNAYVNFWQMQENKINNFADLSVAITDFCSQNSQKILLMIDEADTNSGNNKFLYFMRMLRNKYIRQNNNLDKTFHSVILACVKDLTNATSPNAIEESDKYQLQWNIGVHIDTDLGLAISDIDNMLREYENDYKTGMNTRNAAELIYKYSNGYPYLASKICLTIHDKLDRNFSERSVEEAINIMVRETCPLFKSLTMNIAHSEDYKRLMTQILINRNNQITYDPNVPILAKAMEQSVIRKNENGNVMIHNIIFQKVLLSYFISSLAVSSTFHIPNTQYAGTSNMNLELLISQFAQLTLHNKFSDSCLSENWRLLFISFLKPIVNQMGFYYIIQNSTENLRMTIVARYSNENYIIELNDYYGSQYEAAGEILVAKDADARFGNKGYVITYDHSVKTGDKAYTNPQWIDVNGKKVFKATL